jgi:hypothetical protein
VDAALAAEPRLLTTPPARAAAVLDALIAAGVGGANLAALVAAWPRILTKVPADVGAKARAATGLLGCPPSSLARSPALLFQRRLPTFLAPRFAFVKERAPALAARVAPATLLRGTDADFEATVGAAPGDYAAFKAWWDAEFGAALAARMSRSGAGGAVVSAAAPARKRRPRRPPVRAARQAPPAAAAAPAADDGDDASFDPLASLDDVAELRTRRREG